MAIVEADRKEHVNLLHILVKRRNQVGTFPQFLQVSRVYFGRVFLGSIQLCYKQGNQKIVSPMRCLHFQYNNFIILSL